MLKRSPEYHFPVKKINLRRRTNKFQYRLTSFKHHYNKHIKLVVIYCLVWAALNGGLVFDLSTIIGHSDKRVLWFINVVISLAAFNKQVAKSAISHRLLSRAFESCQTLNRQTNKQIHSLLANNNTAQ